MADISVPYQLVTPSGTITFNDGAADGYRLTAVNGMGTAPVRGSVQPLSARDGAVVMDAFQDAVYPVLEGAIDHTSAASRAVLEQKLESWLPGLMRADGTLKWWGYGANLFANGGFETDTTGWSPVGGGETLTRDTVQHYDGAASLKVVTTAASGRGALGGAASALIPRIPYIFSAAITRTVGTGNLQLQVNTFASNTFLETFTITYNVTGSWVVYPLAFTPTLAADSFNVSVYSTTAVAQTFFVDAVKVEVAPGGAASSAYVEPGSTGYAEPKQRMVRLLSGPANGQSYGLAPRPFQVAFVSGDPLAYGQTRNTSANITINGSAGTVKNLGNRPSPPTIRVYGAVTDPTVTNQTTGGSVTFTGVTLADGQILEIRSRDEIAQILSNRIANGYFETNAANWTSTGTLTRDTVTKRTGTGSGKTVTTAQFQATGSDNFSLTAGVTYEIVAYVNAPSTRPIVAFVQNSTFTNVLGVQTITGNGGWQEVRFNVTPTGSGSYILYFRDEGTGGTTFYIDDVEVMDPLSTIKIPSASSTYPWLAVGSNSILATGTSPGGNARVVVCHRNAYAS